MSTVRSRTAASQKNEAAMLGSTVWRLSRAFSFAVGIPKDATPLVVKSLGAKLGPMFGAPSSNSFIKIPSTADPHSPRFRKKSFWTLNDSLEANFASNSAQYGVAFQLYYESLTTLTVDWE